MIQYVVRDLASHFRSVPFQTMAEAVDYACRLKKRVPELAIHVFKEEKVYTPPDSNSNT